MTKILKFLIIIGLCFLIQSTVATTVAELSWSKSLSGVSVKSVDTDETGSLVVAGLSNGSIMAFDSSGIQKWIILTNASIKKVAEDKSGNVAWINIRNESGFITSAGVQTAFKNDSFRNTTDVSISQDGGYYAVSELSPGKLWVYAANGGAIYASNQSYYFSNYTLAQLDPMWQYIIAVNASDSKIYKWNISQFNSWDIANQNHQYPLNLNDILMNQYPYRQNMSVSGSGIKSFIINSSPALNDQEIGNINLTAARTAYCLTQSGTYITVPFNQTGTYNSFPPSLYDPKVQYSPVGGSPYLGYIIPITDGYPPSAMVLFYNNKYFIINTSHAYGYNSKMVYSSDNGINYTMLTNSAAFGNRSSPGVVVHNGSMYVCGGINYTAPTAYFLSCYASTDGITWTLKSNNFPTAATSVAAPLFSNGSALFTFTYETPSRLWVSPDNAVTWNLLNSSLPFSYMASGSQAAYYGTFKNRLWAWITRDAATTAALNFTYYSSDGGRTWVNTTLSSMANPNMLIGAPQSFHGNVNGGDIYAPFVYQYSGLNHTLYRSSDGTNWSVIISNVSDLPFQMQNNCSVMSVLDNNGIYLTSSTCYLKNASWLLTQNLQSMKVTIDKNSTSNNTYSLYYGNGSAPAQSLNTSITSTNLVSWNWFPIETQGSFHALVYNTSKSLVGIPQAISIPELGGWVGIGETSNVTHVQINTGGFGTSYSGSSNSGTSNQISTGDGASYSTEGRGLLADIYDISGTRKGTYSTGGQVNSVDISQKTGLFTVAGGDDGKVYIFSKDASSNWYVYFQGDSGSPITTTAMSYRGESAVVGRTDGTFEYYNIQSAAASGISVDGYFFKDGAAYKNQPVEIFVSSSVPFNWSSQVTGVTDTTGKFSTTCEAGKYYNFTVNGGEGSTIYLASTGVTTVYVSILTTQQPYSFDAQYNAANGGITSVYTTSTSSDTVQITVTDTNNGTVLATASGTGNFIYTYPDPAGTASVQVEAWISRPGSAPFREIRTVVSPNRFNIVAPGDNIIKYALSTIGLMVMAGLFGYINARRGALLLVGVAVMMVLLDLLPKSLTMFITMALAFAVLGLFGQRQAV